VLLTERQPSRGDRLDDRGRRRDGRHVRLVATALGPHNDAA
jgi:hypothetical protein